MSEPRIISFGCRLNSCESGMICHHARDAGLGDAVIVNTCAVTAEAVRQARQAIRKARRKYPRARILVTGCAAQIDPAGFAAMPEIDHVLGNLEKMQAQTYHAIASRTGGPDADARVLVSDITAATGRKQPAGAPTRRPSPARPDAPAWVPGAGRVRAFVEIQNGCNHGCTFCIIPVGRGRSRSVPAEVVIARIRSLVEGGVAEVILTGVDITAWGADLGGEERLGNLVRTVLDAIPELQRLRLSSLDSIEVDRALMVAIAEEERLMPHLHLSCQSGDDMILKRMKRRHRAADTVRFCEAVRQLRPDMVFGADLIAGFPTESEPMFESTLRLVEECGLTFLHVFPFSARPGTPAARMPRCEGEVMTARARRLRMKGREMRLRYFDSLLGKRLSVLVTRERSGHTPHFAELLLDEAAAAGQIVEAEVQGHDGVRLQGATIA